jgi:hypothetical protein
LEYLQAATTQHVWHRIFGDHFQEKPFLIVGATLRGEFDLAPIIRRGSESGATLGRRSVIIQDQFASLQREFVQRNGLLPVGMTAEAFFGELPRSCGTRNVV